MLHNSEKDFIKRHIGPSEDDQSKMLKKLNYNSLDDLINKNVQEKIDLIMNRLRMDIQWIKLFVFNTTIL